MASWVERSAQWLQHPTRQASSGSIRVAQSTGTLRSALMSCTVLSACVGANLVASRVFSASRPATSRVVTTCAPRACSLIFRAAPSTGHRCHSASLTSPAYRSSPAPWCLRTLCKISQRSLRRRLPHWRPTTNSSCQQIDSLTHRRASGAPTPALRLQ